MLLADAYGVNIDINLEPVGVAKAIWSRGLRSDKEYVQLKKTLPFYHPAVQTAMYLRKHNLLNVGCDADFDSIKPYDECSVDYQDIIKKMNLVMKVFREKPIWTTFLEQLKDYKTRANLRQPEKTGPWKFIHNTAKIVPFRIKTPEEKATIKYTHTIKQSATKFLPVYTRLTMVTNMIMRLKLRYFLTRKNLR